MSGQNDDSESAFAIAIAGTVFFVVLAAGLSIPLNIPLAERISFDINDVLLGIVATLPLVGFLFWFMATKMKLFVDFRQSQLEMFSKIGFEFTWPRIIMMSVAAGVCEEMLFRGVIQAVIVQYTNGIIGVILASAIFGILHWRTRLYALIATAIGIWFGGLYLYTDNLLTPMITHGLYDVVALAYTRQAIAGAKQAD